MTEQPSSLSGPYYIFNPNNVFQGKPSLELVVYTFDKASPEEAPEIPVWNEDSQSYQFIDRAEFDDPEYQNWWNAAKQYVELCNQRAMNGQIIPPPPSHPIAALSEGTDSVEEPEDTEHGDASEFALISEEFARYSYLSEYTPCELSKDVFDDPLETLVALCSTPYTSARSVDLFNDLVFQALSEGDLNGEDETEIKETAIVAIGQSVTQGDDRTPIAVPAIGSYVKTFNQCLQPDKQPLNARGIILKIANSIMSTTAKKIRRQPDLRNFVSLVESSVVVEHVTPEDHAKYYFESNAVIDSFVTYIKENTLDLTAAAREIVAGSWFFEPEYRPRSPGANDDGFEIVPDPAHQGREEFFSSLDRKKKIYAFCVSWLACREDNFDLKGASSDLVRSLELGTRSSDYMKMFRKRYRFVFLRRDYRRAILKAFSELFQQE